MPFCTLLLAALGADVIKVEPPGRGDVIRGWDAAVDGLSTGFVAFNAGKRGDHAGRQGGPGGREVLRRLAASADVFVENFVPGAMARLGAGRRGRGAAGREPPARVLQPLGLRAGRARTVTSRRTTCSCRARPACCSATARRTSRRRSASRSRIRIAGSHAALGIVAALRRRDATGEGTPFDVAMLESAAYWLAYYPHHWWHAGGGSRRGVGCATSTSCRTARSRAGDGRYVNVVVASDADWQRFCAAVGRDDLLNDSRFATMGDRSRNREDLDAAVEVTLASDIAEVWLDRLSSAGLAHGRVRSIREVVEHPQLLERGAFVTGDSPVGRLPLVRFPLSKSPEVRVPGLGEHTREVLSELGYADAEIDHLRLSGAV